MLIGPLRAPLKIGAPTKFASTIVGVEHIFRSLFHSISEILAWHWPRSVFTWPQTSEYPRISGISSNTSEFYLMLSGLHSNASEYTAKLSDWTSSTSEYTTRPSGQPSNTSEYYNYPKPAGRHSNSSEYTPNLSGRPQSTIPRPLVTFIRYT